MPRNHRPNLRHTPPVPPGLSDKRARFDWCKAQIQILCAQAAAVGLVLSETPAPDGVYLSGLKTEHEYEGGLKVTLEIKLQ